MSRSSVFERFTIARQANHSNVYLVETHDPIFISRFVSWVLERYPDHQAKLFSLQTSTVRDLRGQTEQQASPLNVWGELLRLLRSQAMVLFIPYVVRQNPPLEDFLLACSHDDQLYAHKSTVVAFASPLEVISQPVRTLCYEIPVPLPDEEERREVVERTAEEIRDEIDYKVSRREIDPAEAEELRRGLVVSRPLVEESRGLTLFEVQTALLRSWTRLRRFDTSELTVMKREKLRSLGIEYITPERGFESVGGYDYVKDYLTRRIVRLLRRPELSESYGIRPPRGILLFGPPGTGKTWIAKALAKEAGIPAVLLDASTFLRGIVGETEARIRQVTRVIESMAPILVIIDEIDQLTLAREGLVSTDSGVSRRMVNMLLAWMGDEGRRSIVVGTTNHLKDIDPAFLRPGRFGALVPVLLPDRESRLEILRVHTTQVRQVPLESEEVLEAVADRTGGYTGAELEELVVEAAFLASDEGSPVGLNHFQAAMEAIKPDVSARLEKVRAMLEQAEKLETGVNRTLVRKALNALNQAEQSRVKGVVG